MLGMIGGERCKFIAGSLELRADYSAKFKNRHIAQKCVVIFELNNQLLSSHVWLKHQKNTLFHECPKENERLNYE